MDLRRANMDPSTPLLEPSPFVTSRDGTIRAPAKNVKILVSVLAVIFLVAGTAREYGRLSLLGVEESAMLLDQTPREIIPFDGPLVSTLKQFGGEHRERLHWGTYRPFAYLGIRSRVPNSLIAGAMWSSVQDGKTVLRHYCQDEDDLTDWSWQRHDGSTFGRQRLTDNNLVVTTYFVKSTELSTGYGGDWSVRVRIEPHENPQKIEENTGSQSIFFYVGEEGGAPVNLWPVSDSITRDVPFAGGVADEIGSWQVHAVYKDDVKMDYIGLRQLYMPNLTDSVRNVLQSQKNSIGLFQLPDTKVDKANMALIQIAGTPPFEADFVFVSGLEKASEKSRENRIQSLSGSSLDKKLAEAEELFEQRFEETFKLDKQKYDHWELETAKVALSNLLGGVGYFYGQSRIAIPPEEEDLSKNVPYWLYWNASLYTAVPARSTYPRGFLWDEGFHELVVSRWDRDMSLEIIANWMDLMNIDGWIPREQILGDESRSKVPPEYVDQQTHDANPPALLLVLKGLAQSFEADKRANQTKAGDVEFFQAVFPRLERWFNWFNTSQIGKEPGSYYWRGRNNNDQKLNPPTLSSGMDDFPRASHPSDDERHVDIRCWIQHAAEILAYIAGVIDQPYAEKFAATSQQLSNFTLLNELHYDEASGRYYDYGNHSEEVYLMPPEKDPLTGQVFERRMVLTPPKLGWVPQFGLNNLYPLIMHIIPADSPVLRDQLDMIADPDNMWTDLGLRSLGAVSSMYMKNNSYTEAPYWRGPIWINVNYLIMSSLQRYSTEEGPYKEKASQLYQNLRKVVISNIVQQYKQTGFLWEHYDNTPEGKGQGQGVHPFTGWTSLVVLMMAEVF